MCVRGLGLPWAVSDAPAAGPLGPAALAERCLTSAESALNGV
ncbi:hypothetical protein ACFT7S_00690 [Streptomyces sp. NPDC057136]